MKLGVLSPDLGGQIDGSVNKHILQHIPVDNSLDGDAVIVPISWFPNYAFDPELERKLKNKKVILIDFMESHAPSEEYNKFWTWKLHNPPVLIFRRELKKEDAILNSAIRPIEWAAYLPFTPVQTREEYEARPIDVLFFWGYSNLSRPRLHGEIFENGFKDGFNVIDNWSDLGSAIEGHTWATIYAPYWRRKPMVEILPIMRQAKITVSLPGNGKKTFRDTEVIDSLIARHDDGMAFSFPWNYTNSILLSPEHEYEYLHLRQAVTSPDLYDKYVKCHENMQRYQSDRYVNEYIVPEIHKVL